MHTTEFSSDAEDALGNVPVTDADRKDIERILKIFDNARTVTKQAATDGADVKDDGFLFGEFGIADAFYWPVLWVSLISCMLSFTQYRIATKTNTKYLRSVSVHTTCLLRPPLARLWSGSRKSGKIQPSLRLVTTTLPKSISKSPHYRNMMTCGKTTKVSM